MSHASPETSSSAAIELSLHFPNGARLDAEDLALIDAVRKERSILGASRATGVSYRKCWLIIDALNRSFDTPVFATFPGRRGGGAELTPFGERLVALYQSMSRRAQKAAGPAIEELSAALNPDFQRRASGAASEPAPEEPSPRQSRRS
ncbi:MAG: LysR family transcriptional regulator [Methylocystis sp.]|jgi:molybdate transport system regulatory protein